jgi:hypothetical protein
LRAKPGKEKAVIVEGKRYDSISKAAAAYQISVQAMSKRLCFLSKNKPGHFYADSDD